MMKKYIFWLGHTPALSAAEIWTTLRRNGVVFKILKATNQYLVISTENALPTRLVEGLGGTDRVGEVIWEGGKPMIETLVASLLNNAGKINLGLSGEGIDRTELQSIGIKLKKELRHDGRKFRFILPVGKKARLNAAQVIFNSLTK